MTDYALQYKALVRPSNIDPSSAIGIFDSGLGGLSVVNEARRLMPDEKLIYYADSKHAPYGVKDVDFVRGRVDYIAGLLYDMGIKALVVACNTATSLACQSLRSRYDIPIIGMEPALKVAVDAGKKRIAVLATDTTLREQKFESLMRRMEGTSIVYKFPAPSLVSEIESASFTRESIYAALDEAFAKRNGTAFDAIVLGCTHFVLVRDYIQDYFRGIDLYDGNRGTIRNLRRILEARGLLGTGCSQGQGALGSEAGPASETVSAYETGPASDPSPTSESSPNSGTEAATGARAATGPQVTMGHEIVSGAIHIQGLTLLDSNPNNTRSLLNYVD